MSDVPNEKMNLYNTLFLKPVHFECRIKSTRWCVLRLPNASMAQQAGMSTDAFESFYFDVCNLDYPLLAKTLAPLVERMNAAKEVQITGPETDLRFSIEGIPVVPCSGEMNIPDGEVFTAPVRDSVEGFVRFNAPTIHQGASFDGVRLEFKKGKIVAADCSGGDVKRLRKVFEADEGASYIGEWSIGCNPRVLNPMRDILFDEKIAGSFHLTPGNAYDEADNGNRSKIHWDLVQIHAPSMVEVPSRLTVCRYGWMDDSFRKNCKCLMRDIRGGLRNVRRTLPRTYPHNPSKTLAARFFEKHGDRNH